MPALSTDDTRLWLLCLRGQREPGAIDDYLKGLRAAGLHDLRGALVPDSGHYASDEQPRAVAQAIVRFIGTPLA